jgi:FLVCR family feline leukemia virus subgroup C receptor-related protein
VAYPCDETAVESVQQVGGNLVSALMVPVAEWALNQDYEFFGKIRPLDMDIRGDAVLMFALAAITIVYFNTFDSPLRRTMADGEEGGGDSVLPSSSSLSAMTTMTAITSVDDVTSGVIFEGGIGDTHSPYCKMK